MPPVFSVHLLTDGAVPDGAVFVADVDTQLLGREPKWQRVAVVRHEGTPTGLGDDGIVMVGRAMPLPNLGAERDWSDVAHPPTPEDGSVMILHVIRFEDAKAADVTPEHMVSYQQAAARVAGPAGARIAAWFAVDDTPVGDGREWHQARFNAFPSKAAFMAVALDPARLEAQKEHRETAIADTYTMILRATVDDLATAVRT